MNEWPMDDDSWFLQSHAMVQNNLPLLIVIHQNFKHNFWNALNSIKTTYSSFKCFTQNKGWLEHCNQSHTNSSHLITSAIVMGHLLACSVTCSVYDNCLRSSKLVYALVDYAWKGVHAFTLVNSPVVYRMCIDFAFCELVFPFFNSYHKRSFHLPCPQIQLITAVLVHGVTISDNFKTAFNNLLQGTNYMSNKQQLSCNT